MKQEFPVLPDHLHWAKRRMDSPVFHIANSAGRMLCDGGRSVRRGVPEPLSMTNVHANCVRIYQTRVGGTR